MKCNPIKLMYSVQISIAQWLYLIHMKLIISEYLFVIIEEIASNLILHI